MVKKEQFKSAVVVILVGVFGFLGVGCFKDMFDADLMRAAIEINKNCPIMVDRETRLDNTIALPNKVFQYNYTIVNLTKDELDIGKLKKTMQPLLLNNIKTNEDLKSMRDKKVTMKYTYKDKNAVYLFAMEFTYDDYKE